MTPDVVVRKRYIDVSHGQVHCRVAGTGAPVILLHDSPRSSVMHRPQLQWLAEDFTVIALDTPGYGRSTPLPAEPAPDIPAFAAALAETVAALGLGPCPAYGFHTSSKILLAVATRSPAVLSGAILDGLSLPAGPPDEAFIQRYMQPFVVNPDGSHLAAQWTKVLDFHRFFPWFDHRAETRLALDLPDDEPLHEYCVDTLLAGAAWTSAYAGAMRYPARAAIGALRIPATFMCRRSDVLYPYLDALPEPLPAGARAERLDDEPATWRSRLGALLEHYTIDPTQRPAFADPLRAPPARSEKRGYLDRDYGQLHVRRFGGGSRRPLLLLHDSPGSGARLVRLANALAAERTILVPDLPGVGESDALPRPEVGAIVDSLEALVDHMGWSEFDVYAEHLAVPLGVELAARAGTRCHSVVLDGGVLAGARGRRVLWRDYAPRLEPSADGAHLLTAWHMLRDAELSWPWFSRDGAAARRIRPELDPLRLQDILVDILRSPASYGDAALAVLEFSLRERLGAVEQRVLLFESAGDPRYADAAALRRRLRRASVLPRPDDAESLARKCCGFLDD